MIRKDDKIYCPYCQAPLLVATDDFPCSTSARKVPEFFRYIGYREEPSTAISGTDPVNIKCPNCASQVDLSREITRNMEPC